MAHTARVLAPAVVAVARMGASGTAGRIGDVGMSAEECAIWPVTALPRLLPVPGLKGLVPVLGMDDKGAVATF
jgi:hypothetical protein